MADDDKHITKPKQRNSIVTGSSGYASNCASGFKKPGGSFQIHHILSITCLAKRAADYKKGREEYTELCLYCAVWDINAAPNLIGLPLNSQYRATDGQIPTNLPSHQVDHNTSGGYTAEVSRYLKAEVWDKVNKKDKIHKIDVEQIEARLKSASAAWRRKLIAFGSRNGGTRSSWKHRFDKDQKNKWYKPFSMASSPNPRSPGLSLSDLSFIFKKLFG